MNEDMTVSLDSMCFFIFFLGPVTLTLIEKKPERQLPINKYKNSFVTKTIVREQPTFPVSQRQPLQDSANTQCLWALRKSTSCVIHTTDCTHAGQALWGCNETVIITKPRVHFALHFFLLNKHLNFTTPFLANSKFSEGLPGFGCAPGSSTSLSGMRSSSPWTFRSPPASWFWMGPSPRSASWPPTKSTLHES